jgi:lipopolysaccharide transport system ATP-binding protein
MNAAGHATEIRTDDVDLRRSVISARGVSKCHRIYAKPIDRLWQGLWGERRKHYTEFWALRGIDLEVFGGETVGIVGRNGAGKSTLLQLIAGTMQATVGEIAVHGRVAALLELGSGFNTEFTGRENVLMNAQVLGLRRSEVEERFERITDFAGLGSFIDQPVRTYSSGMMVRLAFAVAINIDPDVLIIDEALAVGDEAFQRKCYARIEEIKQAGATILFVSHSAQSVLQLCDRAVLIEGGQRLLTGHPRDVVARYNRLLHASPESAPAILEEIRTFDRTGVAEDSVQPVPAAKAAAVPARVPAADRVRPDIRLRNDAEERYDEGLVSESKVEYQSRGARILDPHMATLEGRRVNVLLPNHEYVYRYRVEFTETACNVEFGMTIKSVNGVSLFGMSSHGRGGFIPQVEAGAVFDVEFRFLSRFQPATYFLNAGCMGVVGQDGRDFLHRVLDGTCFRIETPASDRHMIGFYDLSDEPSVSWVVTAKAGSRASVQ